VRIAPYPAPYPAPDAGHDPNMQLTRFTDYSLRTLVYLGANPGRLCTIQEVAKAYRISGNHLMKVVNRLAGAGYVETVRGKGGGLRLSRAPRLINVGSVVRDMEDRFDIVECFHAEYQDCPLLPACTLKSVLAEATRNFLTTLDRCTLDDMLGPHIASMFPAVEGVRIPIRVEAAGS
jgi:Rrf2 family nitric oxide-sensitive transcriptional repressor